MKTALKKSPRVKSRPEESDSKLVLTLWEEGSRRVRVQEEEELNNSKKHSEMLHARTIKNPLLESASIVA